MVEDIQNFLPWLMEEKQTNKKKINWLNNKLQSARVQRGLSFDSIYTQVKHIREQVPQEGSLLNNVSFCKHGSIILFYHIYKYSSIRAVLKCKSDSKSKKKVPACSKEITIWITTILAMLHTYLALHTGSQELQLEVFFLHLHFCIYKFIQHLQFQK